MEGEMENGRRQKRKRAYSAQERRLVLDCAMQAGSILLKNGAEIFRVEETVARICTHYGVESEKAFVLSNGIFLTAGSGNEPFYAKVQHIPVSGARLDRVAAVNQLSREIEEKDLPPQEIRRRLTEIEEMPEKPVLVKLLASAVGSGCFCCMFGGSLTDCAGAFLTGFLLYIYVLKLFTPHLSKIIGNIGGGALVTVLCMLLCRVGLGESMNYMIIGSIMPLIPGIPFTNGVRDIADGDYIAGSVRLLDAILVFVCIAAGVGLVITGFPLLTEGAASAAAQTTLPPAAAQTAVSTLAAAGGTVAFALLFGVPGRFYPCCGMIGGAGWLLYSLLEGRFSAAAATFFAAVLVMLLSRFFAVREKCPVTVFLISGIIPLVPGAGIYWAAYYMVTDQLAEAADAGFAAVKAVAAIVLGIVCIFGLPQGLFAVGKGRAKKA